jgi:hypothetical protein
MAVFNLAMKTNRDRFGWDWEGGFQNGLGGFFPKAAKLSTTRAIGERLNRPPAEVPVW